MAQEYQINGKTVAIFSSVYTVQSIHTTFVYCGFVYKRQCSADVFERQCERLEEKVTRSLFINGTAVCSQRYGR